MSAADKATEVVAEVAEEVSDQAQEVADISRGLSGREVGLVFGGIVIGAGLGGAATFFLMRRRLETKFSQMADEEIDSMREHYQNKMLSLEATNAKGQLEDIVAERGYSAPVEDLPAPMAITPPDSVVEAAKETIEEEQPADARVIKEPQEHAENVRNVFQEHGDPGVDRQWDYVEERKKRSPDAPYVIHVDERAELDYDEVSLTYYEADDVLCNERDEIVDPNDRDIQVGEGNLNKFGHGSEDPNVVYIRNDRLELQFEIVRSPNAYAEEVHGFTHATHDRVNLERMRARERREAFDDG